MEKEAYQLPAECVKCKNVYELDDDLIGEDWNKTISDVLTEKYGNDNLLCPKCRSIIRIIEEGTFKYVVVENSSTKIVSLELTAKDKNRKVLRFINGRGKDFTNFEKL